MLTKIGHSRRKLLGRASSAILYYPLLRVLDASDARAAPALTKRVIFVHFGAGVYEDIWWPQAGTTLGTLPIATSPFEPYKNEMIMFHSLRLVGATNHGGAPYQVLAGWGAASGTDAIDNSTTMNMTARPYSIDQMIADKVGTPCVNLGVFSNHGAVSFVKTISYDKTGKIMLAEDNPTAAFNKYFGNFQIPKGGTNQQAEATTNIALGKKRLLDYLKDDLKLLKSNLGSVDREAFEYHLEALDKISVDLSNVQAPPTMGGGGGDLLASCNPKSIPAGLLLTNSGWHHDLKNSVSVFNLQRLIMA